MASVSVRGSEEGPGKESLAMPQHSVTLGIDVGDRHSHFCLLDTETGEVIEESRIATTPQAFERRFVGVGPMRVALEAGTHSPWISRVLRGCGHEVLVANARKLGLIYAEGRKNDRLDAENLARLARLDARLLSPIEHRGEASQAHLAIVRSHEALVLEDAARFGRSRSVGAYLGLAPGQRQSGESDPQERISKRGDELLRKLLVQGAHYVLGPFAQDSDLRRHGLKIAERGGKNAKRRAAVAVARKLSVLLHRLWVTGEAYEPLYNARSTLGADPA